VRNKSVLAIMFMVLSLPFSVNASEVPGHGLAVANGPSSKHLAAATSLMFENRKVVALGIASTPSFNSDPEGISRQAALNLIQGAIEGALLR
jgi:hypothetical protein